MKELKRALKALAVIIAAYLIQACVMRYFPVRGMVGSVVFSALAILIVSCGKKYAFCASCIVGMFMECMMGNVSALYVIAYPVITMLCAQYFSDMTDRQLERRRVIIEARQVRISEGRGKKHWWQRFMLRYRDSDLPPVVRIPLCAGFMDVLLNFALTAYLYLIGEDLSWFQLLRIVGSAAYTMCLSLLLMVPCRWFLGMYPRRNRREGGRLL